MMPATRCAHSPDRGRRPALRWCAPALLLWVMLALAPSQAQPVHDARPLPFTDAAEEARFHALAAQLRCVQCQNQSLADSNAQIAQDLRREVLALMQQGRDDDGIKQYLVQRYGQFVLYQPPLRPGTWLLWAGPPLFLAAGALLVLGIVRRRSRGVAAAAPRVADADEPGDGW